MSSDQYAVCPKCQERRRLDHEELLIEYRRQRAHVVQAYGDVSLEEYENLAKNCPDDPGEYVPLKSEKSPGETWLGESFSIGHTDEGDFVVDFTSVCHDCDYKLRLKILLPFGSKEPSVKFSHGD